MAKVYNDLNSEGEVVRVCPRIVQSFYGGKLRIVKEKMGACWNLAGRLTDDFYNL